MAAMTAKNPNMEVLDKISAKLECIICLTDYTDPKLLPCFHAFCKECLEPLVKQDHDGYFLKCPICRHLTRLTPKGVAGLQSNFHVHHLFEIRDALNKVHLTGSGSKKTNCEKCGDAEAAGFCRDCGQFICNTCITVHRKWKEFETHEVISHEMVEEESKQMISLKKKVDYCTRHPGRELRIFCETCSELICTDCTIGLHPRPEHRFNLVTDIFAEYKEELKESLEPIKEQLVTINGALVSFDSRVNDIEKKKKVVETDINKLIDQIQEVIEHRRKELVKKLDDLVDEKLKNITAQQNEIEQVQAQISSCVDYADGTLNAGTKAEVVAMRDAVLDRIEQVSADFETVTCTADPEAKSKFKVTKISENKHYELQKGISELVDIVEDSDSESEAEEWEESSQAEASSNEEEAGSSESESDDDNEEKDEEQWAWEEDSGDDNDSEEDEYGSADEQERLQHLFFSEPAALLKVKRL